jgi:hypothetical protein
LGHSGPAGAVHPPVLARHPYRVPCLFADRTSSTQWWTNQWRLILSGFAYTLFERLRAHLKKTPFERMSASNLRLKLIKGGAVIIRNTRRIRVMMSDAYPYKDEPSDLVH